MVFQQCSDKWRDYFGVSLIELMISVAIGSIIVIAAFSAYLGVAGAAKISEAQGRMNDDAQQALDILTQQIRMAGFNPAQSYSADINYSMDTSIYNSVYLPAPVYSDFQLPKFVDPAITPSFALSDYSIRGCSGSFSNFLTVNNLDDLICVTDHTQPDSIGVSYEADTTDTPPDASNVPTDCGGNSLPQIKASIPQALPPANPDSQSPPQKPVMNDAFYYVADSIFYIKRSSKSLVPRLYCKGNGGDPQVLIDDVEDMQISYGVEAPDNASTSVAGYLTASELLEQQDMAASGMNEPARWKKVIVVRICLQMRSTDPVLTNAASASFLKCDGSLSVNESDLRLRQTFTTTFVLRNRLL